MFGISSVIGPLIGGLFAGASSILGVTGWRWVFLVNVPIGIGALLMVIAFLHLPKFGDAARKPRIDWWGATAVIVALVPLLLVAEQGRTWGWASAGSIACYVVGGLGIVAFLVAETLMRDDAIIPLKLFRSGTFSMATVLGFLVGFAMFGAMLTIPLYLQIVTGLTPTESGFATLPMIGGLMIASIASGQIVARTGRYRVFPVIGTALVSAGYVVLTFMTIDKPLWFLMIGMFLIGLGLGQLMQSITLASQNSVQPRDMGVATSSATFFRQIGGTLGTAVLLSVLFSLMPTNITAATADKANLTGALDAALNPTVASAKVNRGVMDQLWTPIVTPLEQQVQSGLDQATAKVTAATAGAPEAVQQQALAAAADQAHASVQGDRLVVDWSDTAQRTYWVDQLAPKLSDAISSGSGKGGSATAETSDTSFLNGADPALTKPFMTGFNASAVTVYWVGFAVILLAFVLSWFFKAPPLRKSSALQEQADRAGAAEDLPATAAVRA